MTLIGIDCQAPLREWPANKAFGIFRCVREGGTVDEDYARNVRVAENAGAVAGGYHYLGHGRPVRDDVRRFVAAMGNPAGRLVSLDVEDAGLTRREIETWFDEYRRHHPTQPILLYTYKYFWTKNYGSWTGAHLTSHLWAANPRTGVYLGDNSIGWNQNFGGWQAADLWQYRGTTDIGIGTLVDLNAFRGSLAELRALTLALPDTSTGDPVPGLEVMTANSDIGDGVLRIAPATEVINLTTRERITLADGAVRTGFGPVIRKYGDVVGYLFFHPVVDGEPFWVAESNATFTPKVTVAPADYTVSVGGKTVGTVTLP